MKSNEASSAYFNIRPIRNGLIELEVHASSPRGSDAVRRPLVVKVSIVDHEPPSSTRYTLTYVYNENSYQPAQPNSLNCSFEEMLDR